MAKPKLELKKKTDTELVPFGETIVTAMTDNPNFTEPTPTLAAVEAKLAAFAEAVANVTARQNAVRQALVERATLRAEAEALLTQLAAYVEAATEGNESKILSAGLLVRSRLAPVGHLPAPQKLNAKTGDMEGRVDLSWKRIKVCRVYEVECMLRGDAATWERVKTVTASKLTVEGLKPGAIYAFRVRAIGSAGEGPWSDEAVRRSP